MLPIQTTALTGLYFTAFCKSLKRKYGKDIPESVLDSYIIACFHTDVVVYERLFAHVCDMHRRLTHDNNNKKD